MSDSTLRARARLAQRDPHDLAAAQGHAAERRRLGLELLPAVQGPEPTVVMWGVLKFLRDCDEVARFTVQDIQFTIARRGRVLKAFAQ